MVKIQRYTHCPKIYDTAFFFFDVIYSYCHLSKKFTGNLALISEHKEDKDNQ